MDEKRIDGIDPDDNESRREQSGDQPVPRSHHYAFAHDHLPRLLWSDPSMLLFALFEASDLFRDDQLRARWEVVGERFDPGERWAHDGLSCGVHALAKGFQAA